MAEARKGGGKGGGGAGNGFQPLGLSDPVFKGIVRMGFRVSKLLILYTRPSDALNSSLTSQPPPVPVF